MSQDPTAPSRARGASRPQRPRRSPRRRIILEALEDRRLLAASLSVSGGSLLFQAIGGAMNLSISVNSATNVYTLSDPTQPIALGSGTGDWTLSPDGHAATGPASSFSSIVAQGDGGAHNDVVSIVSTRAPIVVSTGAGNDSFFLSPGGIQAAVTLSNPVSNGSDGDAIYYNLNGVDAAFATGATGRETIQGAQAGAGLVSVTSVKPNFGSTFPAPTIGGARLDVALNTLYATPTNLATTLSVAGGSVVAATAGGPTHTFPAGLIDGLTIGGTTAGNTLTIDYDGGVPYRDGATFAPPAASGGASNTLILKGGSFTQQSYLASGPGAGSIAFPNRVVGSTTLTNVVDFSNLSPIIDTVPVAGYTFTAPPGAQTIQVQPGPTLGATRTTRIAGATNAFERVDFANKASVTINTGADADTLAIDLGEPAAGLTRFNVATAGGDDVIVLLGSAPGVVVALDAGAGAGNLIDLSRGGSLAGLRGDVFARATGGSATLKLDDTANPLADSFAIAPGRITGGPIGTFVDYYGGGIKNVEIRGGQGDDTFAFTGFGGATTAETYTVAGGLGNDALIVDSTLPTVNFATGGLLNFGPGQPVIRYSSIERVTLNLAGSPPIGVAATIGAVEARPFVQQVAARFTDAAPTAGIVYYAAIDWGDGSPASSGQIVPTGVTGTYEVLGGHAYAAAATYPVTVTVTRRGGGSSGTTVVDGVPITVNSGTAATTIASKAVVQPAPLAASGASLTGRAGSPMGPGAGVPVATFTDSGTDRPPSAYTAMIDWGDGSPRSPATLITASGSAGGMVYSVFGDHAYARPGSYPVTVIVTKPPHPVAAPATRAPEPGARAIASTTAVILAPAPASVVGRLDPASDSGASNSDGITNVVQPTFSGLVDSPGATIVVVAVPSSGSPILLGAAQADDAGAWRVTSGSALADGRYTITIQAADRHDPALSVSNTLGQPLLIDTYGPKVIAAAFQPNSGSVLVTIQDYGGEGGGSGPNPATLNDPSNYAFAFVSTTVRRYKPPARWLIGPNTIAPGATVGPRAVTVLINGGAPIRGGVYQLTMRSATATLPGGVQDIAGNALDGEFYGSFPSGNNIRGGDFVARLDSIHNRVFAPGTTVGPAPGRPQPPRPQPPRPQPPRPQPPRPQPPRPQPPRPRPQPPRPAPPRFPGR